MLGLVGLGLDDGRDFGRQRDDLRVVGVYLLLHRRQLALDALRLRSARGLRRGRAVDAALQYLNLRLERADFVQQLAIR
jgi:hypothetical protein